MPGGKCIECGYEYDLHTCVDAPDETPVKGDLTVCFNCALISKFDDDLNLVALTNKEIKKLEKNEPKVYNTLIDIVKLIEGR